MAASWVVYLAELMVGLSVFPKAVLMVELMDEMKVEQLVEPMVDLMVVMKADKKAVLMG